LHDGLLSFSAFLSKQTRNSPGFYLQNNSLPAGRALTLVKKK